MPTYFYVCCRFGAQKSCCYDAKERNAKEPIENRTLGKVKSRVLLCSIDHVAYATNGTD